MEAIIYTTNTGSAEQYAKMLAEQTGLSVFSMEEAKSEVEEGSEIIYLGWIMAAQVKGYKTAAKKYKIRAVCAVGMEKTGTRTEQIREKNFRSCRSSAFYIARKFQCEKTARVLPSYDEHDGQDGYKATRSKDRPYSAGKRNA